MSGKTTGGRVGGFWEQDWIEFATTRQPREGWHRGPPSHPHVRIPTYTPSPGTHAQSVPAPSPHSICMTAQVEVKVTAPAVGDDHELAAQHHRHLQRIRQLDEVVLVPRNQRDRELEILEPRQSRVAHLLLFWGLGVGGEWSAGCPGQHGSGHHENGARWW